MSIVLFILIGISSAEMIIGIYINESCPNTFNYFRSCLHQCAEYSNLIMYWGVDLIRLI